MPKQYTFKTTKYTTWLEGFLDSLPSNERSEFIRGAIMEKLGQSDEQYVGRSVTQNVPQKVTPNARQIVTPAMENEVIRGEEIDLNFVVKNMFD